MLRITKVLLIISIILLPDYYVFASPFRIRTILLVVLLIVYLLNHLAVRNKNFEISRDTRNVLLAACALLLYVYISDIIKNDPIEAANYFYPNLLIPVVLLVFEYKRDSFDLLKVLYVVVGISIIFAVLQIFGINENLSTLVPRVGPIKSDQMITVMSPQGLRVSGAAYSTIGFAEYLGIILIITYYRLFERKNIIMLLFFLAMLVVLLFTQTRSAIYGLLPSVALVHIYYKRGSRAIVKIASLLFVIILATFLFLPIIEGHFYRLTQPFDASVIERFQTNYYATLGVLRENPFFGIAKGRAWDVISSAAWEQGLVFGDALRFTTTHHNQILYYLRYYGLVGVGVLIVLYLFIFKKIVNTNSLMLKVTLLSIFIFDLQYSLGHNNKLISNIILWILLSLSFAGEIGTFDGAGEKQ